MGLVLDQLHSVGYVLGIDYSSAAYSHVVNGLRKAVDADPATFALGFDWSTWKPGNRAAEALVRPPGGLANLLDRNSRSVTIKDIDNTTLDRIGTRLADGLVVGATDTVIAQSLRDVVGDPQRALMIAQTEMNRATSVATIDNYNDLGVEQVEWFALDGCELCEGNAEAGPQPIDGEFPSGDSEPPAHPNCRCSLLPWIEGDSVAVRGGGEDVQVDDGVDVVAPEDVTDSGDSAAGMLGFALVGEALLTENAAVTPDNVFDADTSGDITPVRKKGANMNQPVIPDRVKGVPGPLEVERAISRLTILPNPNHPDLAEPEKFVESPWVTVPVPMVNPNLWDDADTVVVDLEDLYGTDLFLKRKNVRKHIEHMGQAMTPFRSYALIAEVAGKLIIIDGHHRLMATWLLGQDSVAVYKIVIL